MLDDAEDPKLRRPGWGGLARRGAGGLKRSERYREEDAAKARGGRGDRPDRRDDERPPRVTDERTARSVRAAADAAASRGATKKGAPKATAKSTAKSTAKTATTSRTATGKPGAHKKPATTRSGSGRAPVRTRRSGVGPATTLDEALGTRRAARGHKLLEEASEAFAEERFTDARRLLSTIAKEAPDVPEVRELHGLILYRLGRWKEAQRELEDTYVLTRDVRNHPILMDCARALGKSDEVARRWDELGTISPDPATMTEGRIVRAGSLADAGDLREAVAVLSKGFKRPAQPAEHHLRRAYALADLLERAGEHVEARSLFAWLAEHDSDFGDAASRAAALR